MVKRVHYRIARSERLLAGAILLLFGCALLAAATLGPSVGMVLMLGVVALLVGFVLHLAVDRANASREAEALERHIRQQLNEDPETGLGTTRQLDVAWIKCVARARRWNEPFCLAVLEVTDAFRTGGRLDPGAAAAIGRLLNSLARGEDSTFRLADSTFAVLLSAAETEGAAAFVERARVRISSDPLPDANGRFYTVYGGVSQWRDDVAGPREMVAGAQDDMRRYGSELRRQSESWGATA